MNRRFVSIMLSAMLMGAGMGASGCSAANPVATITLTDGSTIQVELYPNVAPNTVNNFISLANSGFYDGTVFHRVIADFMIQSGTKDGDGMTGPGYRIQGEMTNNGIKNELKHTRGVISMARVNKLYDSAGSQFFIMVKDYSSLDNEYASFGKVIDEQSMEVVDRISLVGTDATDHPLEDVVVESIRVDTKGANYPEPKTM